MNWRRHAAALREALEREGWDGEWYRRGYFDDGIPLGSAASTECQIDSIAQSWGVISAAGDPARAASAMAAVEKSLVRRADGLACTLRATFRPDAARSRLYQGIPARHSGERWPIYTCRNLVGTGVCDARRRRPGR